MNDKTTLSKELHALIDELADIADAVHPDHRSFFRGRSWRHRHGVKERAKNIRVLAEGAAAVLRSAEKRVARIPVTSVAGGLIAYFLLRRFDAHRRSGA